MSESEVEFSQEHYDEPQMPEGLLDASPNEDQYIYNYSDSEGSSDDSDKNDTSQENISVQAHDLAKSQIKKIEDEMKKMHQKHCQLLKDMDSNYAAIEQETHQRYIEFINKWKDQLKLKIEQYRKVIESLNMEVSEIKDYNSNLQEKINKVAGEKNSILEKYLKEIDEKDENKEKEIAALQSSYEKQIKIIQKEKNEMHQKLDEIMAENEVLKQNAEIEKIEKLELRKSLKKAKRTENELNLRFEEIQKNYSVEIAQFTVESLLKKLEENEGIKENVLEFKKKIEETRKKKINFKRQITQWMQDFEKVNGRPCENSDKEQIKHLYTKYMNSNKKHELLLKKFEKLKFDCNVRKIVLDERNPTPLKMRSKSPSCSLNISVDSVMATPLRERKTPREESGYRDRAESLEKENAQLRKEIRSKVTISGRSANQTPTSVANNIICSATTMEVQLLKNERDQLKTELSNLQAFIRTSKGNTSDPLMLEVQQQFEVLKGKHLEVEKQLQVTKGLMEKYKEEYERLVGQITETQVTDDVEIYTLKSHLAYCNSELMVYRDKLLPADSQQEIGFLYEKKKLTDENANLRIEIQKGKEQIKKQLEDFQHQLKELQEENTISYNQTYEELQKVRKDNFKLQESLKELKLLKEKFRLDNSKLLDLNQQLDIKLSEFMKENLELRQHTSSKEQELKDSIRQRKLLHNQLEDLRGKIRVFCRVRPMSIEETSRHYSNIVTISDDFSINIESKPGMVKTHMYDAVFGPNASQEEVFEDTRRLIQSAVDGFNVCIFAYGQTGSGKTYTIQGYPGCPGITPRGIDELFSVVNNLPQGYTCTVSCYMVELYLHSLNDLLRPKSKDPPPSLSIKTDSKGMVYISDVFTVTAGSANEMKAAYEFGIKNRQTSKTAMNDTSSRSHLIFCVTVQVANNESEVRTVGKISFVDLAGSERLSKNESTQKSLKETNSINKSLSALGDVISALVGKLQHIPYRNNKLTMLMSDSLGGTSKTLMFVNISPASANKDETMISLYYGARVKMITNEPIKNIESKELSRLRTEIMKVVETRDKYKNMLVKTGIIQEDEEFDQSEEIN